MEYCGIDPAFNNNAIVFSNPNEIDWYKFDLSQQKINNEIIKLEYDDANISQYVKKMIDSLWDSHFSKLPCVAIEEQPKPGAFKIKDAHATMGISQIMYTILVERGLTVFWVNPKDVRKYFGTGAKSKTGKSTYSKSKNRSRAKLEEMVGSDFYNKLKKKFKKVDDIADAYFLSIYLKDHINVMKKPKVKKFVSKALKPKKLPDPIIHLLKSNE
jgi:hypothetical protein